MEKHLSMRIGHKVGMKWKTSLCINMISNSIMIDFLRLIVNESLLGENYGVNVGDKITNGFIEGVAMWHEILYWHVSLCTLGATMIYTSTKTSSQVVTSHDRSYWNVQNTPYI